MPDKTPRRAPLARIMDHLGISQGQVVRRTGLATAVVSAAYHGRPVHSLAMVRIATEMHFDLADIAPELASFLRGCDLDHRSLRLIVPTQLAAIMDRLGIRHADLARQAHVSRPTVSNAYHARPVSFRALMKIGQALHLTLADITQAEDQLAGKSRA